MPHDCVKINILIPFELKAWWEVANYVLMALKNKNKSKGKG
jgi:hypothetical protein